MNGNLLQKAVAYHESGHAVMSYLTKKPVPAVSIVEDERSDGRCSYAKIDPLRLELDLVRSGRLVEARIAGLLAGREAELRLLGSRHRKLIDAGAEDDRKKAVNLATSRSGSLAEALAYVAWIREQTLNMFEWDGNWRLVEALAGVLLTERTMTPQAVRRCLNPVSADVLWW